MTSPFVTRVIGLGSRLSGFCFVCFLRFLFSIFARNAATLAVAALSCDWQDDYLVSVMSRTECERTMSPSSSSSLSELGASTFTRLADAGRYRSAQGVRIRASTRLTPRLGRRACARLRRRLGRDPGPLACVAGVAIFRLWCGSYGRRLRAGRIWRNDSSSLQYVLRSTSAAAQGLCIMCGFATALDPTFGEVPKLEDHVRFVAGIDLFVSIVRHDNRRRLNGLAIAAWRYHQRSASETREGLATHETQ